MKNKLIFHCIIILSLLLAALPVQSTQATPSAPAAPAGLLQFTAGGHALGFDAGGMYAATGSHALHVDFTGANTVRPQVDSAAGTDGSPDIPQEGAASFGQVTYADLWDGITLTYTNSAGSLYTTTYSLAPGANPADIRLRYNAPLSLNDNGKLSIAFETGNMTESAPVAWQEIQGERVPVKAGFRVSGQEVSFGLGTYDPGYALTIDPSLVWNTFLGTSGEDKGNGIAVDGSGNVYVTGESYVSWGIPIRAFGGGNHDAFVTKLNSTGNRIWNTFLGGSGDDYGYGIAVDASNVYVTGVSFATWGSPVRTYTSGSDAFAAKLTSAGALTWNTFLGGTGNDIGRGIAVDGSANVYIAGDSTATWSCSPSPCTSRLYTGSYDAFAVQLTSSASLYRVTFLGGSGAEYGYGIAVDGSGYYYITGFGNADWGSPVRAFTAGWDAFAAKLSNSGGGLVWNTFLGGDGFDYGYGIAVDGSNVYVAGASNAAWDCSPVTCTARAYTSGYDTFAAKLSSSTGALTWNTFLGGSGEDRGYGIAVDGSGIVYVSGFSSATWGSPVRAHSGDSSDAFAAKLTSAGALTWNTFLGGNYSVDESHGIVVDGSGNTYVTGFSSGYWGSPVYSYNGEDDGIAVKLTSAGVLTWNTFMGWGGDDMGYGIAADGSGNVYVTGSSYGSWGSPVRAFGGWEDAFVAKLDSAGSLVWNTFLGGENLDYSHGITVDGNGNVYVTGLSDSTWGSPMRAYTSGLDAFAAKLNATTGALTWNAFLGGAGDDLGFGIAVDGSGNVYVTGYSTATWGGPARTYTSAEDAFAAKLNSAGSLAWNTFLGGSSMDKGTGIAVDGSGNAYVTGYSTATWGSPVSAFGGGSYDGFADKLNASTGVLTWHTFLGGSGTDESLGIAVDGSGNAYVTGYSTVTWGSPVRLFGGGGYDAFVTKLNASTGALTWLTFLGGSSFDEGTGIAVDASGNVCVTGFSYGSWGNPAQAYVGLADPYVAKLDTTGNLTWNTFVGGSGEDPSTGIAVTGNRDAYVTGYSAATWGTPIRSYSGGYDAFVAKADLPPIVVSSLRINPSPTSAASVGFTVTFSETVTGVDAIDFALNTTGVTGASITGVGGTGTTYTVTVNTGSGNGTIRLDVVDNDTILDTTGNPLAGGYTGGETYTIAKSLTLTIISANGNVARNPNKATYGYGEVVQLTVTPSAGWSFANWTGGLTGSANPGSVTILGNTSVTANYTQNEYTLTITSAHGTVAKSPDKATYHEGDVVQLTATPDTGWSFANWTGSLTDSANPGFVTIHGNTSVMANYTLNIYQIFLPLVIR